MSYVTLNLFTHHPVGESDIGTTPLALSVLEEDAPAVVRSFYGGDGHTSVREDTLAEFPVAPNE